MSLHASLPMYDQFEIQHFNDIIHQNIMNVFQSLLRVQFRYNEIPSSELEALRKFCGNECTNISSPDCSLCTLPLNHTTDCVDLWNDDECLLYSHICGQLLFSEYKDRLIPIVAPVYDCTSSNISGTYNSLIIVQTKHLDRFKTLTYSKRERGYSTEGNFAYDLRSLAGCKLAINSIDSYSGCVSICNSMSMVVCPCDTAGSVIPKLGVKTSCKNRDNLNFVFHPDVLVTGSHRASVAAVREGLADVASIDCITYSLLQKHSPNDLRGVSILGTTASAPAPPIVVSKRFMDSCPHGVLLLQKSIEIVFNYRKEVPIDLGIEFGIKCGSGLGEELDLASRFTDDLTSALDNIGLVGCVPVSIDYYISQFGAINCISGSALQAVKLLKTSFHTCDSYIEKIDLCGYELSFPITIINKGVEGLVHLWINRGFLLSFGFNHYGAVDAFHQVLLLDPDCVIAHWGIAYNLSENYNNKEVPREDMLIACQHVQLAMELLSSDRVQHSVLEIQLLHAIRLRCLSPSQTTAQCSEQYCVAMEKILLSLESGNPDCTPPVDIVALYAESVINKRPWKLWYGADGKMFTGDLKTIDFNVEVGLRETVALGKLLLRAIATYPLHPGLEHIYVHYAELGPKEVLYSAIPSAFKCSSQWPFLGHLVHMGSHIYNQVGLYEHGMRANLEAIRQDISYGLYKDPLGRNNFAYHGYRVHNQHMCTWGAMFNGCFEVAMQSAEDVYRSTSPDMFHDPNHLYYMEPYLADPWHVLVRFGKWKQILERPMPCSTDPHDRLNPNYLANAVSRKPTGVDPVKAITTDSDKAETTYLVCTAFAHYAKGIANAALGLVENAREQQALFRIAVARVPKSRVVHNVTSLESLAIAEQMLCGEIEYRIGNYTCAFEHLRFSVELESQLPYDEPPGWMFPTRHALGALALEQAEISIYRAFESNNLNETRELTESSDLSMKSTTTVAMSENLVTGARYLVEAITVYQLDLDRYPNNLWSLLGLKKCLFLVHLIENRCNSLNLIFGFKFPRICPVSVDRKLRNAMKYADLDVQKLIMTTAEGNIIAVGASCFCAGLLE